MDTELRCWRWWWDAIPLELNRFRTFRLQPFSQRVIVGDLSLLSRTFGSCTYDRDSIGWTGSCRAGFRCSWGGAASDSETRGASTRSTSPHCSASSTSSIRSPRSWWKTASCRRSASSTRSFLSLWRGTRLRAGGGVGRGRFRRGVCLGSRSSLRGSSRCTLLRR